MKDIVKYNIILYDVLPLIFYTIVFILVTIFSIPLFSYKVIPLIFLFIFILFKFVDKFKKNIKNLKEVQNKFDSIGEIIYQNGECFFGEKSMICIRKYIFSLNYDEINRMEFHRKLYIGFRTFTITMITKNNAKYDIYFFDNFYPFLVYPKEIKQMVEIIKTRNPNIILCGNIKDICGE